jgi:hypothetical protein
MHLSASAFLNLTVNTKHSDTQKDLGFNPSSADDVAASDRRHKPHRDGEANVHTDRVAVQDARAGGVCKEEAREVLAYGQED